ncbi:MAG: hypothetical protein E6J90_24015 [Deltaproteobacteria bacterium]|nr:MAG: hypothetical protein E6J91_30905 [Deltaproteobacteria bacterium]TMQ16319.1 MAG: hypothetical protein E6J90_24015 [Deltaproteobacteria bacterium]
MGVVVVVVSVTGCYAHFDVGETRASYNPSGDASHARSISDPGYLECSSRVIAAQEAFNANGRWWSRSVVVGIVLATAVGAVAIATGRDTPGEHAATTAQAVDAERGFSRLELTTAGLAALAGADALLAWYSTAEMTKHAREVADDLARCPPPARARLAPSP